MRLERALAALVVAFVSFAAPAEPVEAGATTFRFAGVEQGRALLGHEDDWTAATSEFQRQAVLGTREPVSKARFATFNAQGVRAWPAAAEARWTRALTTIAPRLVELGVPMPAEIWLIDSEGKESAGFPYTRGNAIVLPLEGGSVPPAQYRDEELLAHEIFHVVSRHAPQLASRLYALLGYEPVRDVVWPAAWLPRRIANPDAPFDRHAMRIAVSGGERLVVPLLVGRRDVRPGETFFHVLDVRLLAVTRSTDGRTVAVIQNGEPLWRPAQDVAEFLERLGGNTDYVMHPEETMADNFAFLVSRRAVPNPALLERIAAVLRTPR